MTDLRAALLALAFADIDALGAETVLEGSAECGFDEFDPAELIDLACASFPTVRRPWSRFELEALVGEGYGDPVGLLRNAMDDTEPGLAGDWNTLFPLGMFQSGRGKQRSVNFQIADPHLHSGASLPLNLFIDGLASRGTPINADELEGVTLRGRTGQRWDLRTLFVATRWALRVLRLLADGKSFSDAESLVERHLDHELVAMVAEGRFWAVVRDVATSDPDPDLIASLNLGFADDGLCDVGKALRRVIDADADDDFPGKRGFLVGLVRACACIAQYVCARPGDGLSRFVARFDLMGAARDASLGELKRRAVRWTLQEILTEDVVGAEFRKTIVAKSPKKFRREVKDGLRTHHEAFVAHANDDGFALALSMPVGYLRKPWGGPGCCWTDYAQLKDALVGYLGLRKLLKDDDESVLSRAISSIDVAGDEYGSASWPYAIAAQLLGRRKIDLLYTIHAGESFYSPLNGARRVGELLLADRVPDRIGHALALSPRATEAICTGYTPPRRIGDLIQDVAWVAAVDAGFAGAARGVLYDLVKGPAGESLRPEQWVEAYKALWSIEGLSRHGILSSVPGEVVLSDLEEIERHARASGEVSRAVAALVAGFGESVARCDVNALASPAQQQEVDKLEGECIEVMRSHVVDELQRRGVVIESCPTSNVRLASLAGLGAHPLWDWHGEKLSVIVGSDDPVIFGSTISNEFAEMVAYGGETVVRDIARATVKNTSRDIRRSPTEFQKVLRRV